MMCAMKWTCAVVVVTCALGLMTSSSANLLNSCRVQCRAEEEMKAACIESRNCGAQLPDLNAFMTCVKPCIRLGDNCFQRCAFKTDRIADICTRQCRVGGATRTLTRGVPVPGDAGSSGVSTSEEDNEAGVLCYKDCYDSLLNAAMNRLYRKRP